MISSNGKTKMQSLKLRPSFPTLKKKKKREDKIQLIQEDMHSWDCGKDGKQSEAFNVENDEITKQNKNILATLGLYNKKILEFSYILKKLIKIREKNNWGSIQQRMYYNTKRTLVPMTNPKVKSLGMFVIECIFKT